MSQAKRLAARGIQEEKGLSLFGGRLVGCGAALDHLPFGVANLAVRIQGEYLGREVATGTSELAEANLELERLLDRVGIKQVVDGAITRKKGQTIGQFKALVAKGAVIAKGRPAQGRFVDQVQSQARSQRLRTQFTRPGPQQIPSAQAQMLGHQQPEAQQIAGEFIGQELTNLALDAARVGGNQSLSFSRALDRQRRRRVLGVEAVEFFFAGRNRR